MDNKKNLSKKSIIIIFTVCIIFALLITSVILIIYFTNPVRKFKSNLESMNIEAANEIYSNTTKYTYKKDMKEAVNKELNNILNSFIDEKVDYTYSKEKLESLKKLSNLNETINETINDLEKIKESKDYFSKAKELEQTNLVEAYKNYTKVIEKDKNNYIIAQEFIKNNTNNVKDTVISDVNNLIKNNDYIGAKEKLSDLNEYIKNDTTITNKLSEIEEMSTKQKIEKYKNEQEVTVVSTRILVQSSQYKSLYPDMIEVVIKNNTSKTIKDYQVSILGYDSNNYPLIIKKQFGFFNDYEFIGNGEGVNIMPNDTFGYNKGYSLAEDHGISKTIALVKNVTYYDGSTWENPYYPYWLEEYKEKPLH